jgi:hypothetical protein
MDLKFLFLKSLTRIDLSSFITDNNIENNNINNSSYEYILMNIYHIYHNYIDQNQ